MELSENQAHILLDLISVAQQHELMRRLWQLHYSEYGYGDFLDMIEIIEDKLTEAV